MEGSVSSSMWRSSSASVLALVLLGGLGGALCDQIHVQFGVLAYPEPFLFGQAVWVAPLFGLATPAILFAAEPFASRVGAETSDPRLDLAWFVGAYLASGVLAAHPRLLAAAFFSSWLARVWRTPDRAWRVAYALALSVGGVLFEAGLSSTGAFHYTRPDVLGTPLWLAGLYLHGAPLAVHAVGTSGLPGILRRGWAR